MNPFKQKQEPELEYFIIYDTKVGIYREPALAINRHDVTRQLMSMFNDPKQSQNQLVQNAEDFQLFKIGEFSRKTGVITPCHHEHIANFHELKNAASRLNQDQGIVPT